MKLKIKTILYLLLTFLTLMIISGMILSKGRLIDVQNEIFGIVESYVLRSGMASDIVRNKETIDSDVQLLKLLPLPEEKRELKSRIDRKFDESFSMIYELSKNENQEGKLHLRKLSEDFIDYSREINQLYLQLY
ncbi:MAG: hypothetical protein NT004_10535, partial [Bacteroidetes bacterium]|nr:hypothetical protein [Bacteroidota bacterium]